MFYGECKIYTSYMYSHHIVFKAVVNNMSSAFNTFVGMVVVAVENLWKRKISSKCTCMCSIIHTEMPQIAKTFKALKFHFQIQVLLRCLSTVYLQ